MRRRNLEVLRQDFLESRKRVAAGLTGSLAPPSLQAQATSEQLAPNFQSLGISPIHVPLIRGGLEAEQQARVPSQVHRNSLFGRSLSSSSRAIQSNPDTLTAHRLAPMPSLARSNPALEVSSVRGIRNLSDSTNSSLIASALLPTETGIGLGSHHQSMIASPIDQMLLERAIERNHLQQRLLNASFLGRTQADMLSSGRYPSQWTQDTVIQSQLHLDRTQDTFRQSQLQLDRQQRQLLNSMRESPTTRLLPLSSAQFTSTMTHRRQEESKGQEESKRPSSSFDDYSPSVKRQRYS